MIKIALWSHLQNLVLSWWLDDGDFADTADDDGIDSDCNDK